MPLRIERNVNVLHGGLSHCECGGKEKNGEAEKVISCARDILEETWLCTHNGPVLLNNKKAIKSIKWLFEIAIDDGMHPLFMHFAPAYNFEYGKYGISLSFLKRQCFVKCLLLAYVAAVLRL